MKIVFMGTPEFSVPALMALCDAGHDVICAYTQPPRPAGRGKALRPSAVHQAADALGIPVRHPETLRGSDEQAEFAALGADIAVVVAYGQILPQEILDAPARGCLNIHASLLPRWRGAAPIHRAIMSGDGETGVCIMRMEAGLDTGPVLVRDRLPIRPDHTTGALEPELAAMGARLIVEVLGRDPLPDAVPQPEAGVTYAHKIDKAEARIDWSQPASEIDRLIRGLSPFPGAWSEIDGTRIKFLKSELVDATGGPGQVLPGFVICCGEQAVRILTAQRPGKRPMEASEFLRGFALPDVI